jgi:DNA helicase-2/ATP-dependent DNA helicase PcrA
MRWLESCAVWCCGGWRTGPPRYAVLVSEGQRILAEALTDGDLRQRFSRRLIGALWNRRDSTQPLHEWLDGLRADVLDQDFSHCRSLDEERATLAAFMVRIRAGGDVAGMTLGQFAGFGDGADRVNLSSLHSAKGREFEAVVLFGMDEGRIPRRGAGDGG